MLELSTRLLTKAVTLYSTTIDSPTDRISTSTFDADGNGVPIRPTIYFDKPVTKDGKNVPGKKSTLYTPDKDEAAALKANQDSCECICLDGSGKYNPTNELHYRFLKSALDDQDKAEIKAIKGLLAGNDKHVKLKKLMKGFTSTYIMGLPSEQRAMLAESIRAITQPVIDILNNAVDDDEADEPLFS